MLSRVGVVLSLLLLSCSSLRNFHDEKVVACSPIKRSDLFPYNPFMAHSWRAPLSFEWSLEHQKFLRGCTTGVSDCDLKSMRNLCRTSFAYVCEAEKLNETADIPVDVSFFKWYLARIPETGTVPADLYKCKEHVPPEELRIPEGSWSDLLRDLDSRSEEDWVRLAKKGCGRKPTAYALGGRCNDEDSYFEIAFVCDNPKKEVQVDDDLVGYKKQYHDGSQLALLSRFVDIADLFDEAKIRNDTGSMAKYTTSLNKTFEAAKGVVAGAHRLPNGITVGSDCNDFPIRPSYINEGYVLSREESFSDKWDKLKRIAVERSEQLFLLAAHFLTNRTSVVQELFGGEMKDLAKYNVDSAYIREKRYSRYFPDLAKRLGDHYVDYLRNYTLGVSREDLAFLTQHGAHARLTSMFEELFSPDRRAYFEQFRITKADEKKSHQ
ncbi:hypothetical protein QR680_015157 [Steinernema hermaphroditum]|uniref:Uncharacterized protein n=1 Tax=Steinernema hermaphroditum TaxID=289476 RepID=A0AA39ICY2_9BILA|nr:hypothetical protein QR680_015157 [Steinernema hermaphroditum]